jgi:hypothetical protein
MNAPTPPSSGSRDLRVWMIQDPSIPGEATMVDAYLRVSDTDADRLAEMLSSDDTWLMVGGIHDAFSDLVFDVAVNVAGSLTAFPPTAVVRDGVALHPIAVNVTDSDTDA